jgi:hypothetical protein
MVAARQMAQAIAKWLERLGLGKYISVFAENDIDLRALRQLLRGG